MMFKKMILCAAILFVGSPGFSNPQFVTGLYEPLEGGYRLYFTLHNAHPSVSIRDWFVGTEDAIDPFAPSGWRILQNYREVAWDAITVSDWVPPGQSLAGFGYTAPHEPGVLRYAIGGYYYGDITMALIPEPGSLLALGGGLAALGAAILRRRRR